MFINRVMRSHDHYRLECMNYIKNLCHMAIISGLLSDLEDGQCVLTGKSFSSYYSSLQGEDKYRYRAKSVCLVVGLVIRISLRLS